MERTRLLKYGLDPVIEYLQYVFCYIYKKREMITKAKLKEAIEEFPDSFTIDELVERLILIDKIDRANRQSEKGETISENELDKEIEKWFK